MDSHNKLLAIVFWGSMLSTTGLVAGGAAPDPASDAYQRWYDVRKEDPAAGMALARDYLRSYPTATNADYLRKWLTHARAARFAAAKSTHDIDGMVQVTRDALDDEGTRALDFMIFATFEIRAEELFHAPPRYDHGEVAIEFASKALDLIEGGRIPPSMAGSHWDRDKTAALLYQTMAIVDAHAGRTEKAASRFQKAIALEPGNAYNYYALGSLYRGEYTEALARWNAAASDDSSSRAAADAKRRLDSVADRLIEEWARFLALSDKRKDMSEHRAQVRPDLEQVYRFRHPDHAAQLSDLIARYRGGST